MKIATKVCFSSGTARVVIPQLFVKKFKLNYTSKIIWEEKNGKLIAHIDKK
jgi:hypothetical protein